MNKQKPQRQGEWEKPIKTGVDFKDLQNRLQRVKIDARKIGLELIVVEGDLMFIDENNDLQTTDLGINVF